MLRNAQLQPVAAVSQKHGQQPTTIHQAGWHYIHLMMIYEEKFGVRVNNMNMINRRTTGYQTLTAVKQTSLHALSSVK